MSPGPDNAPEQEPVESAATPQVMASRPITTLPDHMLQGLELTRQHIQVVGAIAAMSWGRSMTPIMRRAVSQYCERWGIDPLTELDVLGGSFYINSEYYMRKLGEMRRAGIIADFWFEHIHNDQRLKAMAEDQRFPQNVRDEALRRWSDAFFKRVEQNAPEGAKAVCICYIVLNTGGHPIKGCKWAGNGTSVPQPKHGGGSAPNPIAEANSELSVESMAARRAARQIVSHMNTAQDFDKMESELTELSELAAPALERYEEEQARGPERVEPPKPLSIQGASDVYGIEDVATRPQGEPVRTVFREGDVAPLRTVDPIPASVHAHAATAGRQPDPYEELEVPAAPPEPEPEQEAPAALSPAEIEARHDDGPLVYLEPFICPNANCGRRVVKSNDHSPDCKAFLD